MRIPERLVGAQQLSVDTTDDLGAVAVFFDFENIILGVRDEFRVSTVIDALNERGDVMVRRAYADWGRYRRHQRQFLEQGVAMVFLPSYGINDKNRTDTAICVDAMEILFTRPHIDTFVIASGDSDFGVLAHRLRDHGKRVVGISAKSAASDILVKICHEFIFYESLVGQRVQGVSMEEAEERVRRALQVVVDQHGPRFRASVIKDRMRKQDPTFSERNYGASSFTRFLRNFDHLIDLLDGGMVQVTGAMAAGTQTQAAEALPAKPPVLAPDIEAEAAGHVSRAIALASPDGEPVSLARLKDALGEVAPDFDEMALGFRTFTRFLKTFPNVVEVERDRNRVRPVTGANQGKGKGGSEAPRTAPAKPAPSKPDTKPDKDAEQASPPAAKAEAPAEDEAGSKPSRSRAQRRNARGSARPKPPVPAAKSEAANADKGSTAPADGDDEDASGDQEGRSSSRRSRRRSSAKGDKEESGGAKKSAEGDAKAAKSKREKSDEADEAEDAPKSKGRASRASSKSADEADKGKAKPRTRAKKAAGDESGGADKGKAEAASDEAPAKAKPARTRRKRAASGGGES